MREYAARRDGTIALQVRIRMPWAGEVSGIPYARASRVPYQEGLCSARARSCAAIIWSSIDKWLSSVKVVESCLIDAYFDGDPTLKAMEA